MTKEEIGKAAREYAQSLDSIAFENLKGEGMPYLLRGAFKTGAESVNKHWQEKTRWIPVEEKIPPRQSRTRQILAKNKHTVSVVFISCTEEGYLNSIESLKREFTDWKEIE